MKATKSVQNICVASLFTAMIAVFTAWLFHIPVTIGANTAYLHFGDTFIFLLASLLPAPYAVPAAMLGGGLGDLLCGGALWIPFTLLVKGLMVLCFTSKKEKLICKRNIFALLPCLLITVGVYYVAEAVLYGNWISPVLSIFGNVVQIIGSGVLYVLLATALEKAGVKQLLNR